MKPLDKKQIPQFAALCVVTAGLAGYLVMHLIAPGPVSAGTRTAAAPASGTLASATPTPAASPPATSVQPAAVGVSAAPADAADASPTDAPPPTPGMHDPFAVGYVDPATMKAAAAGTPAPLALPKLPPSGKQTAALPGVGPLPVSFPEAPALPGSLSGFSGRPPGFAPGLPAAPAAPAAPALPAGPVAPIWTVTGVLQGASGKVAILRSGDARRIVRSGDFVDSTYRVIGVTRTSVTLRHGTVAYQLMLGASKAVPAKAGAVSGMSFPPVPHQAATLETGGIIPVYHMPKPGVALAHLHRQGPGLALASETPSMPRQAPAPVRIADAISYGLHLLNGGQ